MSGMYFVCFVVTVTLFCFGEQSAGTEFSYDFEDNEGIDWQSNSSNGVTWQRRKGEAYKGSSYMSLCYPHQLPDQKPKADRLISQFYGKARANVSIKFYYRFTGPAHNTLKLYMKNASDSNFPKPTEYFFLKTRLDHKDDNWQNFSKHWGIIKEKCQFIIEGIWRSDPASCIDVDLVTIKITEPPSIISPSSTPKDDTDTASTTEVEVIKTSETPPNAYSSTTTTTRPEKRVSTTQRTITPRTKSTTRINVTTNPSTTTVTNNNTHESTTPKPSVKQTSSIPIFEQSSVKTDDNRIESNQKHSLGENNNNNVTTIIISTISSIFFVVLIIGATIKYCRTKKPREDRLDLSNSYWNNLESCAEQQNVEFVMDNEIYGMN